MDQPSTREENGDHQMNIQTDSNVTPMTTTSAHQTGDTAAAAPAPVHSSTTATSSHPRPRSRSSERHATKSSTADSKSSKRRSRSRSRSRSPSPKRRNTKESSKSRSSSRSRSRTPDKHKSSKHKSHKRRRSRSSSASSSSSSDSSSSESDSDSDSSSSASSSSSHRHKRHKNDHKKRKDSKSSKKKSKKHKKDAKSKKSKKDKKKSKKSKKDKKSKEEAPTHVQQSWGAHGILRETDIYNKSGEFYTWCMEVKNISRDNMSKRDEKELFSEFAEDYNTSTLPHEKYYDLEKWSLAEASRGSKVDELAGKTDEERIRIERQRDRASIAAAHENARIQTMKLLMQKERMEGSEAWAEIQKRQDASLQKATFESIAKQREQDKRDAELLAKQKRR